jgi:hypothetical protein
MRDKRNDIQNKGGETVSLISRLHERERYHQGNYGVHQDQWYEKSEKAPDRDIFFQFFPYHDNIFYYTKTPGVAIIL